jgi:hypothetical protein
MVMVVMNLWFHYELVVELREELDDELVVAWYFRDELVVYVTYM